MEQMNLRHKENITLVKNNRYVFYEVMAGELERIVTALIRFPVQLQKIEINLPKSDKLIFALIHRRKERI